MTDAKNPPCSQCGAPEGEHWDTGCGDEYTERTALIEQLEGFGLKHIDWSDLDTDEIRATRDRVREKRARGAGYRNTDHQQQEEN